MGGGSGPRKALAAACCMQGAGYLLETCPGVKALQLHIQFVRLVRLHCLRSGHP